MFGVIPDPNVRRIKDRLDTPIGAEQPFLEIAKTFPVANFGMITVQQILEIVLQQDKANIERLATWR